jgi:hypothetical protein
LPLRAWRLVTLHRILKGLLIPLRYEVSESSVAHGVALSRLRSIRHARGFGDRLADNYYLKGVVAMSSRGNDTEKPSAQPVVFTSKGRATLNGRAALNVHQAANFCGYDHRDAFDNHIRPFVPVIDMRPQGGVQPAWRWYVDDLEAFLDSRRREPSPRTSRSDE